MARDGQHQANLRVTADTKHPNAELQALAMRAAASEKQIDGLAGALQRTGKAAKVAAKDLGTVVRDANKSVASANAAKKAWELEKTLARGRNALENRTRALAALDRAQLKAASSAKVSSSAFSGVAGALGGGVLGGAAGAGLVATARMAGQEINQLAERGVQVGNVFANLKMSIEPARAATRGLVNDFELATFANMSMSFGIESNSQKFAELTEAAVKLGARINQDAKSSVESLFIALSRQSQLMLDNLGIVLKVEDAHKIYAKQLGVTVNHLTEAQRAEAFRKVAIEKVIEAAKGVTLETDNASSAVKRFGVELDNIRDRALGGERSTISLKQAILQLNEQERKLIETGRIYGTDAAQLRRRVVELGVSWDDAKASLAEYGEILDWVNKKERRAHVDALASGQILQDARKKTAESVKVLAVEASKIRLREIEEEKARFAHEKKFRGYILDLEREEVAIKAWHLQLEGKVAEAEKLRHEQKLENLRNESAARAAADGQKSDPAARFKPLLVQAENAKRLREFGDTMAKQRDDEIKAEAEFSLRFVGMKEEKNARIIELDMARLEHRRKIAELEGATAKELFAFDHERMLIEERRAESSRQQLEAELAIKEAAAHRMGDIETLAEVAMEKEQIQHDRKLERLKQQMTAEQRYTEVQEAEARKRQEIQQRNQQHMIALGGAAANAAMSIAESAKTAAEQARAAGMDEANARRVAAGEALLAISKRLAGQAIAAGIEAAAAFATYRYADGVMNLAAAAIYGAGAGTLAITGRQLVASGKGSGSGGSMFGKPSISRPSQSSGGRGGGGTKGSDIPSSDIPVGTTSDRNSPTTEPRYASGKRRGDLNITINAKVLDKGTVREIFKQGNELYRTEKMDGVPSRRTGT